MSENQKITKGPGEVNLTRRNVTNALAMISAGAIGSPLFSRLAAAETSNEIGARMVAAIFFESYATIALQRALRYAGEDGFVSSMPQLLHARVNAPFDNIIWNTWFTSNSEESVVTTPQGNHVVVTVHGGGIFASPARIDKSLRADLDRTNPEGLTGQYAAKISVAEARDLLGGNLPDGSEVPIYPFDEFKRGIADLPMRYAVVLDFELAKLAESGYVSFEILQDDPSMIIRAGGTEELAAYLDKASGRNDTDLMGSWHPYNRIDPQQHQTRLLRLAGNKGGKGSEGDDESFGWGYDSDYGIGTSGFIGLARYVAVAPRNVSTSLQYLDFET
jgi:hypothetical protein